MNQADPIFNPASPEYIGTTVAFNPFGDFRNPIPSNDARSVEFARVHPVDIDTSKLATLDATIYTTDLFDLPAGGIGFALGGQFRRESLDENPDQLNVNGDIAGNSAIARARGGRKSYAIFVETNIPIFSEKNAVPGFHALDINAAGRYEEFMNNNTNVCGAESWGSLAAVRPIVHPQIYLGTRVPRTVARGIVFRSHLRHPTVARPEEWGRLRAGKRPRSSKAAQTCSRRTRRLTAAALFGRRKVCPGLTISTDLWQIDRTGVVQSAFLDAVLAREVAGTLLPGEAVNACPTEPSRASSSPTGTRRPRKQTASISAFSTSCQRPLGRSLR